MKKKDNIFIKTLHFHITKKIFNLNQNYIIEKNIYDKRILNRGKSKTLSRATLPLFYKDIKKNHFLLNLHILHIESNFKSYTNRIYSIEKKMNSIKNAIPLIIKNKNLIFHSYLYYQQFIEYFNLFLFLMQLNLTLRILIISKHCNKQCRKQGLFANSIF